MRTLLLLLLVGACAACPIVSRGDRDRDPDREATDAGPEGTGFPPPATDLTLPVGTASTLDVATWNVKNFPCGNESSSSTCRPDRNATPALLADLIASLDLDLVALEEIADEDAFDEVVQRLPEHEGVLSTDTYSDGSYQKVGFIYRATVLELAASNLVFQSDFDFPRPGLQGRFTWTGEGGPKTFLAIAVHLKAGEANADFERRGGAIASMEAYARNLVDGAGEDNILFLGDWNEDLRDPDGLANFAPFRDATRYAIRTKANADAREVSFIPAGVILDHIVTTSSMGAAFGTARPVIPRVDSDVESYRSRMSDHLPVTLRLEP